MKPRLFIGSSTEALNVAYAIQESLENDALSKVWTQGIFELSGTALDNLLEALGEFDFAVFVFQPDDLTRIRDLTVRTVRDNVIFELGLFISKLGKERVYFLVPKDSETTHLPTDLLGIEPGHYIPPEKPDDLLAALGPFCNKVRRHIATQGPLNNLIASQENEPIVKEYDTKTASRDKDSQPSLKKRKKLEDGIFVDEFGNTMISIAPTVFFADRVSKSFPGIRGLQWFNNPKEALDRLSILLRKPLRFEESNGYGVTKDPIWWFRGGSTLSVDSFERLTESRCILDVYELEVQRLAIFHSRLYWQSYVYVETHPDNPIGLYPTSSDDIKSMIESFGYASEEYGLFQNVPITRSCYDDGAASIDGVITDTSGAQLRVRYLSKYNLLITSKFSPINTRFFDHESRSLLDDILKGRDRFTELHEMILDLPRNDNDD